MHEPQSPTPYAEVNAVLRYFLVEAQAQLGANFVGMYLIGSLALGDFDPQASDIDFVVVTADDISGEQFGALRDMHWRFDAAGSPWAGKVEAVYVSLDGLQGRTTPDAQYPQMEKGRTLFWDRLESGWIFQAYTLREHGVVVAGPDPGNLLAAVEPDEMRRVVAAIPLMWQEQAREDPSWLKWLSVRENQAFVVLTLCRLLYTLDTATVAAKPAAAQWAREALGERWAGLIAGALVGQRDIGATPQIDAAETVALIEYTVERYREWESVELG